MRYLRWCRKKKTAKNEGLNLRFKWKMSIFWNIFFHVRFFSSNFHWIWWRQLKISIIFFVLKVEEKEKCKKNSTLSNWPNLKSVFEKIQDEQKGWNIKRGWREGEILMASLSFFLARVVIKTFFSIKFFSMEDCLSGWAKTRKILFVFNSSLCFYIKIYEEKWKFQIDSNLIFNCLFLFWNVDFLSIYWNWFKNGEQSFVKVFCCFATSRFSNFLLIFGLLFYNICQAVSSSYKVLKCKFYCSSAACPIINESTLPQE